MGTYELYLLKSVTALSLLFLFYWFLLRNETYYSWNRLFLLCSLILSFLFPMFSFSIQHISPEIFAKVVDPVIINGYLTSGKSSGIFDSISILSVIYISGAVFFCLRLLLSLAKIHFLYWRYPKCKYHGFTTVILDNDQSPFTFFNVLFISRIDYKGGKIDEMIVHEKAHKEQYHSFDILLLEVMTIIQWFNPFIWLFGLALKSEHEFIADNKVLQEGFDKVKYQKLLFEKCLGITSLTLTNNFNYSLLKKRLKMMTISRSSSLTKVKYLLSVPVLLLTVALMAINANSYGQKDKVYKDVDVIAKYKNGSMEDVAKFIQQNIIYPKDARDHNVSAKIYVQFMVNEKGKVSNIETVRSDITDAFGKEIVVKGYKSGTNSAIDPKSVASLEAEAKRVVKLLSDFTPAQKDGKNVNSLLTIPIYFLLEDKKG
jgi:hypothetical protein